MDQSLQPYAVHIHNVETYHPLLKHYLRPCLFTLSAVSKHIILIKFFTLYLFVTFFFKQSLETALRSKCDCKPQTQTANCRRCKRKLYFAILDYTRTCGTQAYKWMVDKRTILNKCMFSILFSTIKRCNHQCSSWQQLQFFIKNESTAYNTHP